ncbi:MAG TPA: zinc ribbon domain-containing protein, partial [Blastocatellia bacterium]|nr:zinc ribbon domain-containing protein [Blastocatellia bacterium]
MHCPNCGTKASANQKFCRSCGFGLEKIEQMIVEQKTAATDQTTEATGKLSNKWLRKLEKWAGAALLALGGILGGLLLWAIIVKVMLDKGKVFEGGVLLMMLAAAALFSFLGYLRSESKKSASAQSKQPQRLPEATETAKMLPEPNTEMAASVAEHTT